MTSTRLRNETSKIFASCLLTAACALGNPRTSIQEPNPCGLNPQGCPCAGAACCLARATRNPPLQHARSGFFVSLAVPSQHLQPLNSLTTSCSPHWCSFQASSAQVQTCSFSPSRGRPLPACLSFAGGARQGARNRQFVSLCKLLPGAMNQIDTVDVLTSLGASS